MSTFFLYAVAGVALFGLGLFSAILHADALRKVLALNVMGSGVFLVLIAAAYRAGEDGADPVPHAMVLTGIVVAVSATALALAMIVRLESAGLRAEPDAAVDPPT